MTDHPQPEDVHGYDQHLDSLSAQMSAHRRRAELYQWMQRRYHDGLSATEIADVSGIYSGHGRSDRCFDDLKALAAKGLVERWTARPARWSVR